MCTNRMRIREGNHVLDCCAWKTTAFGVVIDLIVSEYYGQNRLCIKDNTVINAPWWW
jgi:hypothetical protein